jgi:uncharacterized protein
MTDTLGARIARQIAGEIAAAPAQVISAVALLDEGATVPFIARYRKEVTGGLDDTQLRTLAERLTYLRELEARRTAISGAIAEQGKMTDALGATIGRAASKAELEDIYLPYKTKRRTKAMIARENGLQGLADGILADRGADPAILARGFVLGAVPDTKAALEGARDIIAEGLAENADLLGRLRSHMKQVGRLACKLVPGQEAAGAKFSDYFAHDEPWASAPSHRVLAMMRGQNEGFLSLDLEVDAGAPKGESPAERACAAVLNASGRGLGDLWLREAAAWAFRIKIKTSLSLDLMGQLREQAGAEAISVFARNLKALLLAAPAGGKATMGLDPGIRTGVKLAVIDATGKVLGSDTVYPFQPKNDLRGAQVVIAQAIAKHGVRLIAIGNGTASRETEKMVADLLALLPGAEKPIKVIVSEAGASVYSASALAAKEFPDLDVSIRGAVSIARRLQDPLAELVKIEPNAIGVGQYQHDVDQSRLSRALDAVVEDAVNHVGVDLNTASAPLLARVSGVGPGLAEAIVVHRDANGPFASRKDLLKVARLGPKVFEQAAGFLRITGGREPLDASSVHPEAYDLARRIVGACGRDIRALMSDPSPLKALEPRSFVDARFGLPTVRDILAELEKPGRDPRPSFKTASFAEGINEIKDLRPGMVLEGTVTNVAAFGAFVDIGVHQDGLVHVSQLSDSFVKDPHAVVKAGDVVKVRVVEVDAARKRIGLTMKSDGGASARDQSAARNEPNRPVRGPMQAAPKAPVQSTGQGGNAFADALKGKFPGK